MTTIPVQITMDDDDFNYLCHDKMPWNGGDWGQHVRNGRFDTDGGTASPPSLRWEIAYWVGPDYVAVILAKSFLAARKFSCEVIFDTAGTGEWMILTDYDYTWPPAAVSAQQ